MQINAFIRFKQIWDNTGKKGMWMIIIQLVNLISLAIAFISGVGMLLVGAYTFTDSAIAHVLGANLAFVSGILYFIFQTPIGPFVEPKLKIRWILLVIRMVMILASFVWFVLIMVHIPMFGVASMFSNVAITTVDKYSPFTIISPLAEWLFVFTMFALFATFIPEFHYLKILFEVKIRKAIGQKHHQRWKRSERTLSYSEEPYDSSIDIVFC